MSKNLAEKVLEELTPGTMFRGFFLVGFDPNDGRKWYFNLDDKEQNTREENSSVYYPTSIRYFKSTIEKVNVYSLSFVDGTELGLILDVQNIANLEEGPVTTWYGSKIQTKSQKIFAVECFLIENSHVGTFLILVDETKKSVYVI